MEMIYILFAAVIVWLALSVLFLVFMHEKSRENDGTNKFWDDFDDEIKSLENINIQYGRRKHDK